MDVSRDVGGVKTTVLVREKSQARRPPALLVRGRFSFGVQAVSLGQGQG